MKEANTGRHGWLRTLYRARMWYLFVLPLVLYFLIFKLFPLYYTQIAFRDYRVTRSIEACEWVDLENFQILIKTPGFWQALGNTLLISLYKLAFCFPIPILMAVLLSEMRSHRLKRVYENILYLPHFLSWVIVGSVLANLTALNGGLFNNLLRALGQKPVMFLGEKEMFRPILVLTDIWKETGWSMIVYLAALAGVDPELYDAAKVDGANWYQRIWHISLAGIKSIIVVLFIMRVGNLLNVGFEQVQTLVNDMTLETGDILDTFVYRIGIQQGRYSIATAAGVFKSAVAALMLFLADRFSKALGEEGLF